MIQCKTVTFITTKLNQLSIFHRSIFSKINSETAEKSYYITTPIFYVNAAPHIGHLYTSLLADASARWRKICGEDVVFATGTDEHGLKIQQSAALANIPIINFCDNTSLKFKKLFNHANINYTDFVRTTEGRHCNAVIEFWNRLKSNGFIYKGFYEGWYSMSDEAFVPNEEIAESKDSQGNIIYISSLSMSQVEWMKEENYMFKLSMFSSELLKWLDRQVIKPKKFEAVVRKWIEEGLPDLSVSRERSRLKWGIPVPGDDTQTIYVWLDALVNYLTVIGYPNQLSHWPPSCQLIGKDILKFHAIYWPSFLLAADLELPEKIVCHSHWIRDNIKMSKSKGNIVDPFDEMNRLSVDGLRYYLLKESTLESDGNYSDKAAMECINSNLASMLGNLLSRCTGKAINPKQEFPPFDEHFFRHRTPKQDIVMIEDLKKLPSIVDAHFRNFDFYKGLEAIDAQLHTINAFIQLNEPWTLKNIPQEEKWLQTIIGLSLESLRICALLLQPITPDISKRLLDRLNIDLSERNFRFAQKTFCFRKTKSLGEMDGHLIKRVK